MKYYILVDLDERFFVEDDLVTHSSQDFRKASLYIDILKVKKLKNRFPVFKVMEVKIKLNEVDLI